MEAHENQKQKTHVERSRLDYFKIAAATLGFSWFSIGTSYALFICFSKPDTSNNKIYLPAITLIPIFFPLQLISEKILSRSIKEQPQKLIIGILTGTLAPTIASSFAYYLYKKSNSMRKAPLAPEVQSI